MGQHSVGIDTAFATKSDTPTNNLGVLVQANVDFNIDFLQIPMQIIFLGWMTMAEILDNPFGYNMEYDVNLAEVRRFVTRVPGARVLSQSGIGAVTKRYGFLRKELRPLLRSLRLATKRHGLSKKGCGLF